MITVTEATHFIQQTERLFPTEQVPLSQAQGRILRQELQADRDFPPFDRVAMDGIAIEFAAYQAGQRRFPIAGRQDAGMPQQRLTAKDTCLEIMTGAVLPQGTDTVIRYEDVQIAEGIAEIQVETVQQRQNIHARAKDRNSGDLLLGPGRCIGAAEIAVAATVGQESLQVSKRPHIAILSTGDELVPVGQVPLPHQIRQSNGHMVEAALLEMGLPATRLHLPDEPEIMRRKLAELLESQEVLILSGGVSMGKADFLPGILNELGVVQHFHKVRQRPGKPFWFGSRGNTVVFALPGNPVSTFVNFHRYVRPWLWNCLGVESHSRPVARLAEAVAFRPSLTYFLQVKLRYPQDGSLEAIPQQGHGSGDHANLLDGDGWVELPAERDTFEKGEAFPFLRYRVE
jgi:molybdopterin molybdotransferase